MPIFCAAEKVGTGSGGVGAAVGAAGALVGGLRPQPKVIAITVSNAITGSTALRSGEPPSALWSRRAKFAMLRGVIATHLCRLRPYVGRRGIEAGFYHIPIERPDGVIRNARSLGNQARNAGRW